jgi:hypothetical protein
MAIRFPSAGYTPDQLRLLSREYHEDLVDEMCKEDFDAAIRIVRKRAKFFPTVAEIIEACQEVKRSTPGYASMPYYKEYDVQEYTEEEWERSNKERLKALARSVGTKIEEVEN